MRDATPRQVGVLGGGPTGMLYRSEPGGEHVWTPSSGGPGTPVTGIAWSVLTGPSGTEVVAAYNTSDDSIDLFDTASGTTVKAPLGSRLMGVTLYGPTLVQRVCADRTCRTSTEMQLWRAGFDGTVTKTAVHGFPDGALLDHPVAGDARSAVVPYTVGATRHLGLVDLVTGRTTELPEALPDGAPRGAVVTPDAVLWRTAPNTVRILDRSTAPGDGEQPAPVRTVEVPGAPVAQVVGLLGEHLVVRTTAAAVTGQRLVAVPVSGGGQPVELLKGSAANAVTVDGALLVAGGGSAEDWAVHRIGAGPDGLPVVRPVVPVPSVPTPVRALSLAGGTLTTATRKTAPDGPFGLYGRDLATTGAPEPLGGLYLRAADPFLPDCGTTCVPFHDSPGGPLVMVRQEGGRDSVTGMRTPTSYRHVATGSTGGRVLDASGDYAVYDGGSPATQHVVGLGDDHGTELTRPNGAAAVWGGTLFSPGSTAGSVTTYDLRTDRTTGTVAIGAPCRPAELQAVGRWLYWTCGANGPAGVFDRDRKVSVRVGTGEALLGDGYLMRYDTGAGKLVITAFDGGTATDRVVAPLPSFAEGSGRRTAWTVDRFGGHAAYLDERYDVHIVPTGVTTSPATVLDARADAEVDLAGGTPAWEARWRLSKPVRWTVTLRNKASGATVRTLTGDRARATVDAVWNGKDTAGRLVANGTYTWDLTGTPADGHGAAIKRTGTVRVTGGAAVYRDHAGSSGFGDLLTLNSSGTLTYHQGTGSGTYAAKTSGSGWGTGVTAVPFGDLSGDRCNDTLIRPTSGALRVHRPACGKPLTPASAHTTLATSGWNRYDVLTSPGDLNGDGRPDLVAREKTTGDVYLYQGTADGKLAAKRKVGSRWTGYRKIVGAGDLNGDGRGDLLAQDKSNELWRYHGTASGTLSAKVKVADDWGASYQVVVGTGDITGDGKADLVARDTSGTLYRHNGDGKGRFGGRVKIATGWQTYKGVF
ncbi:FG-GAP-like repeat-containing protein [Streptomyces sp. NPDC018031]|uniref:FG-GAP-like repeat-containing protein n=1 Tax=Streptomyces sp. NPDC018031 TaxID=3365033 RepID=UPI0037A27C66